MQIRPHDLLNTGDRYEFAQHELRPGQTVTLTVLPGPPVDLTSGTLALVDPWWPDGAPALPAAELGTGGHPTGLSAIALRRPGRADPATVACAAWIGHPDQVTTWRPIVRDGTHVHLEVDSGLGAFHDLADTAALLPSFRDDPHMKEIFDRTHAEQTTTMELGSRVAAVIFECPDGPGRYPVHLGLGRDDRPVAVLVDLLILSNAERRVD